MRPKKSDQKRLTWDDVKDYTPALFFHNPEASPPLVAKRLWAAISNWDLNEYETEVERSSAKSLMMTLAMIYQEFRRSVWKRSPVIQPTAIGTGLEIPHSHVVAILKENRFVGGEDDYLADLLLIDLMNRDEVGFAIMGHLVDQDEVFRLLAFPIGLSREQHAMELQDLLKEVDACRESDDFLRAAFAGDPDMAPDWEAGFAFIESGFHRSMKYDG